MQEATQEIAATLPQVKFTEKELSRLDDCWLWTGGTKEFGHGQFWFRGRDHKAHRIAWMIAHGPVPDNLLVCHECDVPACCNVAHLWLGTVADNNRDMYSKGRGTKAKGEEHGNHQLTESAVNEMRSRRANGVAPEILSTDYGISRIHVWRICSGKAWRHSLR